MKLLSIAIPCYNSQDYMEKCIESLLVGGEEVEILVFGQNCRDCRCLCGEISYDHKGYPSGEWWTWRSCQCRNQKRDRFIF